MAEFTFVEKNQETEKIKLTRNSAEALTSKDKRTIAQLNEQFDINAYRYQEFLKTPMSSEEKEAAKTKLVSGYDQQLVKEHGDAKMKERTRNQIASKAKTMADTTSQRLQDMRAKVKKLAEQVADTTHLDYASVTLTGLAAYKLPKKATAAHKRAIKAVKKTAPEVFKKFRRMENLYQYLQSEKQDVTFLQFVAGEVETSRAEWQMQVKLIEEYAAPEISENQIADEVSANDRSCLKDVFKNEFIVIDQEAWKKERTVLGGKGTVDGTAIQSQIDESLRKREIDWDRDIAGELREAQATLDKMREEQPVQQEGQSEAQVEEERRRRINLQERKVNDLQIESYVKSSMQNLIERSTANPKPTMKEIEKTVVDYLKEIGKKADIRFRVGPNAAIGILNGCAVSSPCDEYKDLMKKYYLPHGGAMPMGNLTFVYMAGKNADEYQGKNDYQPIVGGYGSVAIKLNKEKVKHRCGVIAGNSLYNYDKQKARSLENPDILGVGMNLSEIYERATAIKAGKKMLSAEQEANFLSAPYKYFEGEVVGRVAAQDIDELTFHAHWDLPRDLAGLREEFADMEELKKLYQQVNLVNKEPKKYDRVGMPPLQLTVWGKNGVTVTYHELKLIFGA